MKYFLLLLAIVFMASCSSSSSKRGDLIYPDTTVTAIRYAEKVDSFGYSDVKDSRSLKVIFYRSKDDITDSFKSNDGVWRYKKTETSVLDSGYLLWHAVFLDSSGKEFRVDSSKTFFKRTNTWLSVYPELVLLDYRKDLKPDLHRRK